MKKLFALLLSAVMLCALLAACGAETGGMSMDNMAAPEMESPGEGIYGSTADSSTSSAKTLLSGQKLIRTVELRAETEDLDTLLTQLAQQISTLEGYTEYQNVYNGGSYVSYRTRSAELTVRIPADRLDSFLNEVEGFSNVISKTESVDDVTLQYTDTQGRVDALQAEHDRLVELMEKAETMSDLLEIEARLTDVRYELESVTSQLRVLDNQVSYATIELYIEEVEILTEVEEPTVWERITSGLMRNLQDLGDSLVDLFVWIVVCSPQLLILAAVVLLVVWLFKRAIKKRRQHRFPSAPPQPPENNQ